jgi:cation:H+ antiporter
MELILILAGLAALLISGDLLVRGAVGVARALAVPPLIVSLTIVAFGTSAPELFVATRSVLSGAPGIALGAIAGSNVANLLLVIGLPALFHTISTSAAGLRQHAGALMIATAVYAGFVYGRGGLDQTSGAILLAGIFAYVAYLWIRAARGARVDPVIHEADHYADGERVTVATLLYLISGIVGLPLAAGLLTDNAASLAAAAGVRAELIGLTIVAVGTSLPELATVLVAALRGRGEVALGSVIGSNIFNIFAVGGAAGLAGGGGFDAQMRSIEIPFMLAATLAVALAVFLRRDIGRPAGLAMLLAYAAFIALSARNAFP